jgi:hypothetical protein
MYICQLQQAEQNTIKALLNENLLDITEVENAMNGRLSDIEDIININRIIVYNDEGKAFEGFAEEFLYDNAYDEDAIEMVNEAITVGCAEREFFSGLWTVKKAA